MSSNMADVGAQPGSRYSQGGRRLLRGFNYNYQTERRQIGNSGNESTDTASPVDVNKLEDPQSETASFTSTPSSSNPADEGTDSLDARETLPLNPNQTHALPFPRVRQATRRLLASLQFKNPGPLSYSFACFNPETSEREMRKLRRVMHSDNPSRQKKKSTIYDDAGKLIEDGRDLCDCLDDQCPGCHYPCPECGSEKCGPECRCNRRWLYEQIEVEGTGEVVRFTSTKSSNNKRS